jgi:glycosyltransferase involved in cell wall biosynthesis
LRVCGGIVGRDAVLDETAGPKLVYLMNHFSRTGSSHFAHVLGLLDELGQLRVRVRLIIEKGELPTGLHENVEAVLLPESRTVGMRMRKLHGQLASARQDGFRTVFVRITPWAALVAILAMRGRRGRVFFWQSGTTIELDRSRPWGPQRVRWLVTSRLPAWLAWRLCDRFVTGPEPMVDYYATVGGIDRSKIRLLYNDVDLRRFGPVGNGAAQERDEVRAALGLAREERMILFVHRFSPVRKTLAYLPKALVDARSAGALEGWRLVVLGNGPELPAFLSRVEQEGLADRVISLGELPNLGIERLYRAADLFIQPSFAEGFPRVLIEAMAAGLPIVTTDAGGSAAILGESQQRFVTPRDDPAAFASALTHLLKDETLRGRLAQENLEAVRRFDTHVVARMYRKVLFEDD